MKLLTWASRLILKLDQRTQELPVQTQRHLGGKTKTMCANAN